MSSSSASNSAATPASQGNFEPTFVGPSAEELSKDYDLTGKTVVITGANSGLGKESARVLLLRGAFVILGARNKQDGEKAVAEFTESNPSAKRNSLVLQLDLSDKQSIIRFANDVKALNRAIDVLLLNAGFVARERVITPWAGVESQFAVNHLGHFLLTQLLLDAVLAGGNSRVVALTSLAHAYGQVQFDDINFDQGYNKFKAYGQSKTANILFIKELNRRFEASGSKARAYAVHPGVILTKGAVAGVDPDEFKAIIDSGSRFKTVGQGAATSVWASAAPELEGNGGLYLEDARISEVSAPYASDLDNARRLWELSEELVKRS